MARLLSISASRVPPFRGGAMAYDIVCLTVLTSICAVLDHLIIFFAQSGRGDDGNSSGCAPRLLARARCTIRASCAGVLSRSDASAKRVRGGVARVCSEACGGSDSSTMARQAPNAESCRCHRRRRANALISTMRSSSRCLAIISAAAFAASCSDGRPSSLYNALTRSEVDIHVLKKAASALMAGNRMLKQTPKWAWRL